MASFFAFCSLQKHPLFSCNVISLVSNFRTRPHNLRLYNNRRCYAFLRKDYHAKKVNCSHHLVEGTVGGGGGRECTGDWKRDFQSGGDWDKLKKISNMHSLQLRQCSYLVPGH